MGPVRHRQLIRLLSCIVALNLVAGAVALYARGGSASATAAAARSSRAAEHRGSDGQDGGDGTDSNGILAGGHFRHQRGSGGPSGGSAASGPSSTTATSASPAPTGPLTTTGPTAASTTQRPTTSSTVKPATSSTTPPSTAPRTAGPSAGTGGNPTGPGPGSSSSTAPAGSDGAVVINDPVGDTNVDGTNEVKAEDRADIVWTRATNRAASVTLSAQFRQPVDPKTDSRWGSESTFIAWEIDTNGDGAGDYEAQFFVADGNYGGAVSQPGDAAEEALCEAVASYGADSGYTLVIESSCLGDPASFSYRAGMYYDTDPKDPNADVIFDATPNGGFSFPVARRP